MGDVDLVWEFLLSLIFKCANTLCPLKNITVPSSKPPWFTNEILEAVSDWDEAFSEAYESQHPDLLLEAKLKRTEVKRAIRNARASYVHVQLANNANNPRRF